MSNEKFDYKKINSKFIVSDLSYQRPLDMTRVGKIVSSFNINLVNPVKVSFRDNKYYVFDGQHTLAALKLKNKNNDLLIDCKIYYGLTKQDEAKLFSEQNGISRSVDSNSKLKALYTAGDIDVCIFQELTEKAGIKMNFSKGKANNKIVACKKAFTIYKNLTEAEYLEFLDIIKDSWEGHSDSFNTEILGGIYIFCKKYKDIFDKKRLIRQLTKVSPLEIIREGKLSYRSGDERFGRQILHQYNKNLQSGRLADIF